jgi:hypothetical protein
MRILLIALVAAVLVGSPALSRPTPSRRRRGSVRIAALGVDGRRTLVLWPSEGPDTFPIALASRARRDGVLRVLRFALEFPCRLRIDPAALESPEFRAGHYVQHSAEAWILRRTRLEHVTVVGALENSPRLDTLQSTLNADPALLCGSLLFRR